MLYLKTTLGILFQTVLFGLFILVPAQTWLWEEAIIFLLAHFSFWALAGIYLCIYCPQSLEARFRMSSKNQPSKDKWVSAILMLVFFGSVLLTPIDVFYWSIFGPASWTVQIIGFVVFIIGTVIMFFTLVQNAYLSPLVEVQAERGHRLVDTGLYGIVRHPMYLGFLLWLGGALLWLGSIFVSSLGSVVLLILLLVRISVEEDTLKKDLEGYMEYTKKVKYKLIPWLL